LYGCCIIEYCGGGSLYALLRRSDKALTQESQIKILKGIAAGMYHLHSENIIHRDLAARNILLTDDLIPKVSDFGLSRQKESDENVTESASGPLKWMAPEALKERKYSTKSDVWSFGVVVWEVVHKEDPYPGLTPARAAMGVVFENLRLEVKEDCPPVLQTLIQSKFCFILEE
jgi:serine/threonine protein kinase